MAKARVIVSREWAAERLQRAGFKVRVKETPKRKG